MNPSRRSTSAKYRRPRALRLRVSHAIALAVALALTPLSPNPSLAADPNRPHPHRGKLEPFVGAPPRLELDAADRARLAKGEPVLKQVESRSGGRGMLVQDIHAAPQTIWNRIGDFRAYPRMVKHVRECEPYFEHGDDVRVRFVISVLGLHYEYYVHHVFHPQRGWVTWTLDYTRESDLDDSVGYWAVKALSEKPGWSRLFYSIDMRTRGWMPGFLRHMIAGEGLRDATRWVKREAEAEQRRRDTGDQAAGPSSASRSSPSSPSSK